VLATAAGSLVAALLIALAVQLAAGRI